MSADPWKDPDTQQWMKRVLDDLSPKIASSALTVSLVPRTGTDVKFAVELGISIMYDKPIILVIQPGTEIPDHLRRVADEIVDFSAGPEGIAEAIQRVVGDEKH